VVLLTNYIPPYWLSRFRALDMEVGSFRVLESISMPPERPWVVQHSTLNVETQRTLTFTRTRKHPRGFRDQVYIHVPYDTLGRLYRLKPDVIISDQLGARTMQAVAYGLAHPESRVIIWAALSEHTEQGIGPFREVLRRVLLPLADAVLVNGASGAKYVKRFGVADQKIFVAPPATDGRQFSSLRLERQADERRRLIYVGRLIELKGLVPFLSVLSIWCVAHPTVKIEFWLVGDGPERAVLEKAWLPRSLTLHFFGNVAYDDLPALYAQVGVLAFPTLSDAWGLVVNEAMAAGLPVFGSVYSQAVEELVQDGVNGWTFRTDRFNEVYAALDRALVTPPDDLLQMGAAARKAVEHLTPELSVNRIMDAIRFVLGGQRSRVNPLSGASPPSQAQ
jgi:glycosyltransferase involved in cell wall biosynthesis